MKAELKNYRFSGIEASQIGALKSVTDYYNLPIAVSQIYGLTGLAFLNVQDQFFKKPNAGPPESEVYKLARNFGLQVEGVHTYAEGEMFKALQAQMWSNARDAIDKGYPVFAKNIDIENQTSVIYGYDSAGYYTHSWHTGDGHENWDDVIPWNQLGLSKCPCAYCQRKREGAHQVESTGGLISLHWVTRTEPLPIRDALKMALKFAIDVNDQGVIHWQHETYYAGQKAYQEWLSVLEANKIEKYWFSLTLEPIADARKHAVQFLIEVKDRLSDILPSSLIAEAIDLYGKIAAIYRTLVHKFPYEQPLELLGDEDLSESIVRINKIAELEEQGFDVLRRIYHAI